MATGRFLVIDGDIPITSKRCFSCKHYSCEKKVGNLEKFCSGEVMKINVPERAFCDEKRKDVSYNDRCSHWSLDAKIRAFLKKKS